MARELIANGLQMHIEEQGEGAVVLFVHGFPETSHAWRHQLRAVAAAGFHAVAPDLRGYGRTEVPPDIGRYSVFDLVGDLVGILDALGCEQAIVVGNDWGSTIAWTAALMRPDRFKGVVAIGVPMMGEPPVPPTTLFPADEKALFYTLYFQEPGIAEAELEEDIDQTLRKILFSASREAGPRKDGDGTPNPFGMVSRASGMLAGLPNPARLPAWLSEEDLALYVASFSRTGFRGGLNYYRNLDANWSLKRALAGQQVVVPALFMVGEQDVGLKIPGMHDIISSMPELVPRLTDCLTIKDCGHWAPQERPREVSEAIIAFARSFK